MVLYYGTIRLSSFLCIRKELLREVPPVHAFSPIIPTPNTHFWIYQRQPCIAEMSLSTLLPVVSNDGSDGIVGLDWTPLGVHSPFAHLSIDESPITDVVNEHRHPSQPPCNISWYGELAFCDGCG